jgi:hypothetical protein
MESGDGNEFRESEWRRLLGLLDARRQPRAGVVIDFDAERNKRRRLADTRDARSAAVDRPG